MSLFLFLFISFVSMSRPCRCLFPPSTPYPFPHSTYTDTAKLCNGRREGPLVVSSYCVPSFSRKLSAKFKRTLSSL
uniref:Putative secreted protein n=1 Tax=Anopheles triannulatus TaxID=58253 RepID=A0A2M4B0N5_9DIPT